MPPNTAPQRGICDVHPILDKVRRGIPTGCYANDNRWAIKYSKIIVV
jgi:hypothetical protein